jgi:hypothetical protein
MATRSYFLWEVRPTTRCSDAALVENKDSVTQQASACSKIPVRVRAASASTRCGSARPSDNTPLLQSMRKATRRRSRGLRGTTPWTTLFTSKESYIDDTLCGGLPLPENRLGPVRERARRNLVASEFSRRRKFADTSPTQRGKIIRIDCSARRFRRRLRT